MLAKLAIVALVAGTGVSVMGTRSENMKNSLVSEAEENSDDIKVRGADV